MECLLPYLSMVTVSHIMVGLERMLDYRGVGLERFHCTYVCLSFCCVYPCLLCPSVSLLCWLCLLSMSYVQ